MARKPRTTLTKLDRPVRPPGLYSNFRGYRKYAHTREFLVAVDGVEVGEVHTAKHSGSYGTTYWVAVEISEDARRATPHSTRAEALAHLVARYDAEHPATAAA